MLVCLQADRHSEAARLLMDAAAQLSSRQAPPLQIKKLYVLAALEVEAFRKKAMSAAASGDAGRMGSDGAARSSVLSGAKPAAGAAHTLAGEAATQPPEWLSMLTASCSECPHALCVALPSIRSNTFQSPVEATRVGHGCTNSMCTWYMCLILLCHVCVHVQLRLQPRSLMPYVACGLLCRSDDMGSLSRQ